MIDEYARKREQDDLKQARSIAEKTGLSVEAALFVMREYEEKLQPATNEIVREIAASMDVSATPAALRVIWEKQMELMGWTTNYLERLSPEEKQALVSKLRSMSRAEGARHLTQLRRAEGNKQ